MRITRLEIFGFKSFRDRFVLNFDRDIIGIVGPNGCGKSNIVDALRWILGETHAKHLRGEVLEDLIFNGSESHRPLGMAEVSITIRPEETWRPASSLAVVKDNDSADEASTNGSSEAVLADTDLASSLQDIPGLFDAAEIQLTRRLYRSGESEYFINRVPCRLRDMVELYRLIGLGARGLSVVQQGQIGQIVSKKPVELRELLEEAAGISGFRARIETAQRKLDQTRDNILRLTDIIAEVEKQARVLKRQANRARVRNDLKAELKSLEISLFETRSTMLVAGKLEDEKRLATVRDQLDSEKSRLTLLGAQEIEKRGELEALEVQLVELRARRDEVTSQIQAQRLRQNEARVELARREAELHAAEEALKNTERRANTLSVQSTEQEQGEKRLIESVQQLERQLSTVEAELALLRADESRAAAKVFPPEIASELEPIFQRITTLEPEVARFEQVTATVKELEEQVAKLRSSLHQHKDQLHERRVLLAAAEGEVRSFTQQLESLAAHAAQQIAPEALAGAGPQRVLLSALTVPKRFEKAVSAVLDRAGSFLIVENGADTAKSFAQLSAKKAAQFGVINNTWPAARAELVITDADSSHAPSVTALLDHLTIETEFQPAAHALLGSVYVVDSLDQAIELNKSWNTDSSHRHCLIVTEDGCVVTWWGWFTTQGEGMTFGFTRELENRRADCERLTLEMAELLQSMNSAEERLREAEIKLRARISEKDSLVRAERELGELVRRRAAIEERVRHLALESERKVETESRRVSGELARARGMLESTRSRRVELEEEIAAQGLRQAELRSHLAAAEAEVSRLRTRIEQGDSEEESRARIVSLEGSQSELDRNIRGVDERRAEIRRLLADELSGVSQLRSAIDKLQTRLHDTQLAVERRDLELGLLLEEVRRSYGETVDTPDTELQAKIYDLAKGDLQGLLDRLSTETEELRRRLEREGEVDPQAIELYEMEQTRLDAMRIQFEDLDSAAKTLLRTIQQLKEISRNRFLDTFTTVSEKFVELIPRLFGGGAGKMELINPDDPLASGVQLSVRPPGKNPRTLDLLSGGEKALTATAVVVAMFLHRPSPICVLDEVDAPLDDANLQRFLALVREIAGGTQFLVITHNKLTMAAADRLVGITMQEKGISTALAVSFEDAERDLEQWVANG